MKIISFIGAIKLLDEAVTKHADASNEVQKDQAKFYIKEVTKLMLEASKSDMWPDAAAHIALLLYNRNLDLITNELQKKVKTILSESLELLAAQKELRKELTCLKAQNAADTRHDKPGGSRDKQKNIRTIWASGKYNSRDLCAEQECAALDMSFSAARKALRNTPNPT